MSSAQDPFYIVKEEIQDSINTLQATFHQWEHMPVASGEHTRLTKELLSNCESIEWQVCISTVLDWNPSEKIDTLQATFVALRFKVNTVLDWKSYARVLKIYFTDRKVDELEKAISVAARDPALYGIDQAELERRFKWTRTARTQVGNIKKPVTGTGSSSLSGMRQELMRLPSTHQQDKANHYVAKDNDDFISSESDRQMLLIRQQDEELDELSASVERIGSVGLTIHDELHAQKKVAVVMKKASAKGQMMMILFLIVLFIILFVLVFFT
ncbi:Syntaxin 6, N-terminal [Cynara cardunculus var. scolymus]|uniref:Syntaxin 6, N-terminal n=1 Tax=Cynara cardunculus var. scolymus TaxID=59895 RepID=A0A103YDI2_CYNCS|nr:Syntaxin 6, N-terminal [Cynara cardunculus var. scolymus]